MTLASEALIRIKRGCQVCGFPIHEILSEYDRQRSGVISVPQLQRAFSNYGIRLKSQDYDILATQFKSGTGISIPSLSDAVTECDSARQFKTHPEVAKDLLTLAHELSTHQQTIWDCTKSNRGRVSFNEFIRSFSAASSAKAVANAFVNRETGDLSIAELDFAIQAAAKELRPEPPMAKPEQVISAINYVVRRAVDIQEAFEAHDKLRRGKVSSELFAMILSTFSGLQMPPKDIQIVADFYSQRGIADYTVFVRDIEDVARELRSPPPSPPPHPSANVDEVLSNLKTLFSERRMSPRSLFPLDGNGKISKYAFERIISQTAKNLTRAEIASLSRAFPGAANEVDYSAFISVFEATPPPDDVTALTDQIKSTLTSRKLQLRPVISRFDRFSGGEVGRSHLMIALQSCSVILGSADIDRLIRRFPGSDRDRCTISISALCDAVDPVLPRASPQSPPPPAAAPPPRASPTQPVLDRVLRVALTARALRIDLEVEFRQLDRLRHGFVSEAQWRAVAALLNRRVPEPELRVVFAEYQCDGGFDYVAFCRDCAAPPQETHAESPALVDALRKCKAFVVSKMTAVDVLFRRYDPIRSGLAPIAVIYKAFADYGLLLGQGDVAALGEAFRDSRDVDKFSYAELERRLEGIVVKREEHVPTLHEGWTHEEYQRTIASVKTELREKLHARPRAFPRLIANVRQGNVSEREFLQLLEDSGVVLLKEQREALLHCYRIPGTGNIDFVRFTNEIENTPLLGYRPSI